MPLAGVLKTLEPEKEKTLGKIGELASPGARHFALYLELRFDLDVMQESMAGEAVGMSAPHMHASR